MNLWNLREVIVSMCISLRVCVRAHVCVLYNPVKVVMLFVLVVKIVVLVVVVLVVAAALENDTECGKRTKLVL